MGLLGLLKDKVDVGLPGELAALATFVVERLVGIDAQLDLASTLTLLESWHTYPREHGHVQHLVGRGPEVGVELDHGLGDVEQGLANALDVEDGPGRFLVTDILGEELGVAARILCRDEGHVLFVDGCPQLLKD